MKTPACIQKTATATLFVIAVMLLAPGAYAKKAFYEDIFPSISDRSAVDMTYLGEEAYETIQYQMNVSNQTRALVDEMLTDVNAVVIYSTTDNSAIQAGKNDLNHFINSHPEIKLLAKSRNKGEHRERWFLAARGNTPAIFIAVVYSPQYFAASVFQGQ